MDLRSVRNGRKPLLVEEPRHLADHLVVADVLLYSLALMLELGPQVVPLPGPSRRSTLETCLAAARLELPKGLKHELLGDV